MSAPNTPRRSKRGQPLIVSSRPKFKSGSILTLAWTEEPLHTRTVNPEMDFGDDDDTAFPLDDEDSCIEAVFYNQFHRAPKAQTYRSGTNKRKPTRASCKDTGVYKVGDTVLINTEHSIKPSIGVIVAMWQLHNVGEEDAAPCDANMRIRVRWFSRPEQLPKNRVKRDSLPNEIYFTSMVNAVIRASSIKTSCVVSSEPLEDDDDIPEDRFYCHLVLNSRGAYFGLDWAAFKKAALEASQSGDVQWGSVDPWTPTEDQVSTKSKKKKKPSAKDLPVILETEVWKQEDVQSESTADSSDDFEAKSDAKADDSPDEKENTEDEASQHEDSDDESVTQTPSRKRKRGSVLSTPRKKRTKGSVVKPTPRSKVRAAARKKKGGRVGPALPTFTSTLASRILTADGQEQKDPWLRAMHTLHVGSRPDALPCRTEEYGKIMRSVEDMLDEGSGGCVYISGVPGTGKTATVHGVIRQLKQMAENNETNPFTFVEINGLRIPEPSAAYTHLWSALSDSDTVCSANESLKCLTRYFSGSRSRGPSEHACIVLMDELDQLVTTKQDVVYNFFNWPTIVGSRLIVLAVANTMDLPERALNGRVRSRLGMTRISFMPYKTPQLQEIVKSRLKLATDGTTDDEIYSVIEVAAVHLASMKVSSITGDARRVLDICRRAVEVAHAKKRAATTFDIQETMKSMQNSPTAAYLRDCSFHERVMLASLLKCVKREGVEEIKWADVQYQHVVYMNVLPGVADPKRKPTPNELNMVLDSLLASHAISMELPNRKAPGERKIILNLEPGDIQRVLGDVGGKAWAAALIS